MKKKICVLLFANDRKVNKKAIKMIDNLQQSILLDL